MREVMQVKDCEIDQVEECERGQDIVRNVWLRSAIKVRIMGEVRFEEYRSCQFKESERGQVEDQVLAQSPAEYCLLYQYDGT